MGGEAVYRSMIRCQSSSEPGPLDCDIHRRCSDFFSLLSWGRMASMLQSWIFPFLKVRSSLVSDNTPAGWPLLNWFPQRA